MTNPGIFFGAAGGGTPDTLDSAGAPSDGGQNGLLTAYGRKEALIVMGGAGNSQVFDCSNYHSFAMQIVATAAAVVCQQSNDLITWSSLANADQTAATTQPAGTSRSAIGMYAGAITARYFRINTAGTATIALELYTGTFAPSLFPVAVTNIPSVQLSASSGTSDANSFSNGGAVQCGLYQYNGASWDRQRFPATFKTATATASGNAAVWTPTAGKKFRLMRFKIELTGDAAITSGAELDVTFQDASSGMAVASSFYCPATAVTTSANQFSSGWHDLGNGILSALANNVLNVNLSSALATGKCRVMVCGTEE